MFRLSAAIDKMVIGKDRSLVCEGYLEALNEIALLEIVRKVDEDVSEYRLTRELRTIDILIVACKGSEES